MTKFDQFIKESKQKKITATEQIKLSKYTRSKMSHPQGDRWDDPDKFVTELINVIESYPHQKYEIDEYSEKSLRSRFSNKRSDIYINLDSGTGTIEFLDSNDRIAYVHISWYNDPNKKHETYYECSYYLN